MGGATLCGVCVCVQECKHEHVCVCECALGAINVHVNLHSFVPRLLQRRSREPGTHTVRACARIYGKGSVNVSVSHVVGISMEAVYM